ncbi:TPA: phospholipase D family protein [Pseudomonas aeruginosa]
MDANQSTFVAPADYRSHLIQLLDEQQDISIAVAFWGDGAAELIANRPGKRFRILCNLDSGGSNPYVIRDLCKLAQESDGRVQVLQCDRLHAKVVLGDTKVLTGSANLSGNGLGLDEGAGAHWIEAGVLSDVASVVDSARAWFKALWTSQQVREISSADIERAITEWSRKTRIKQLPGNPADAFDLTKFSVTDLEGQPAYVLIYRARASEEAGEATEEHGQAQSEYSGALDWWPFECWPIDLSAENDVDHLAIYYASNGRVIVDGACRMIGRRLPLSYKDAPDEEGHFDLALGQDTLLGRPFGDDAKKQMAAQLHKRIRAIWQNSSSDLKDLRRLHISEFARLFREGDGI